MKLKITLSLLSLFSVCAFAQPTVNITPFATGFTVGLTDIEHAQDGRLFVVEKLGYISVVDSTGTVNPNYFLDINNKVTPTVFSPGSEQGLLGLAFSPDYATDGFFYVNYTNKVGVGNTVISRFSVSDTNPNYADAASEEILMEIYQPYSNHNGGDLAFGPDGFLYIAVGDGGLAGDPGNRAQNPDSLLGKILRIDVSDSTGYTIPQLNPYAFGGGAPEIWAIGLRNPWRISFDRLLNNLWIADVGQGSWEEINMQSPFSTGGENYGWRCYEGSQPYNTAGCSPGIGVYTLPVYEYSHATSGGCSITGGYVYRGISNPDLTGYYFYSDYCTSKIYALSPSNVSNTAGTFAGNSFTTFGENANGELFIGSQGNGVVYMISSTLNSLDNVSEDIARIMVYPNPNNGNFTCDIEVIKNATTGIVITDVSGRVCYTDEKKFSTGENTFTVNMNDKAAGSYLMKLTTANGVVFEKFEVIK